MLERKTAHRLERSANTDPRRLKALLPETRNKEHSRVAGRRVGPARRSRVRSATTNETRAVWTALQTSLTRAARHFCVRGLAEDPRGSAFHGHNDMAGR